MCQEYIQNLPILSEYIIDSDIKSGSDHTPRETFHIAQNEPELRQWSVMMAMHAQALSVPTHTRACKSVCLSLLPLDFEMTALTSTIKLTSPSVSQVDLARNHLHETRTQSVCCFTTTLESKVGVADANIAWHSACRPRNEAYSMFVHQPANLP